MHSIHDNDNNNGGINDKDSSDGSTNNNSDRHENGH